jgi:mRNA degradation ribonuclease J1/J2
MRIRLLLVIAVVFLFGMGVGFFAYEEAKLHIRESVDQFVTSKIDRQPLIIPLLID